MGHTHLICLGGSFTKRIREEKRLEGKPLNQDQRFGQEEGMVYTNTGRYRHAVTLHSVFASKCEITEDKLTTLT